MTAPTNLSATSTRTVTEEDLFRFDLEGYLVIPDVLDAGHLRRLDDLLDPRVASDPRANATILSYHGGDALLGWGEAYRELIDHPRITPYLQEFIGPRFRLDHDYGQVVRAGRGPAGTTLHGGNTPFDECWFYTHRDGRIRCGLVAVAFNLNEVRPDEGGFACIPGSHKANYPIPRRCLDLSTHSYPVRQVPAPAGSAIIFTEALAHGTLPWRGAQDRRTLFYKYSPPSISWAADFYDAAAYPGLTQRQREILEGPNARYPHRPRKP